MLRLTKAFIYIHAKCHAFPYHLVFESTLKGEMNTVDTFKFKLAEKSMTIIPQLRDQGQL